MFKSILPTAKRNPGADAKDSFATLSHTYNGGEGKENSRPGSLPQIAPKCSTMSTTPNAQHSCDGANPHHIYAIHQPDKNIAEPFATDREFEKLLDNLQIPTTLRPKLATLESPVKAAMLRSSHVLISTELASQSVPLPKLRRSLSSTNLDIPRQNPLDYHFPIPPQSGNNSLNAPLVYPVAPFMLEGSGRPSSAQGHTQGSSLDLPRSVSHLHTAGNCKPGKGPVKDLSPAAFCAMLSETSSTQLDLEIVKKLRLLLRNETASWSEAFLRNGGYAALLTRLVEILEIEWREEQHDDQILHEFLRCFKALSTSTIGCLALRSSFPTPFVQLVSLLYSDKKPGDLCTRQLIVDLLQILFEIYPATSLASAGQNFRQRREIFDKSAAHPPTTPTTAIPVDSLPLPHKTLYSLVRALLLTPAPPPTECPSTPISPHAFIASLHLPRIFKSYLQELSDVCRDYFWVFCHPHNAIWNLDQTDEAQVERPRAPGGMTGGVEFEAMGYLTTHLQLVNALAKAAQDLDLPPDNEDSAHRLHADLFASGFEKIILTTRKASMTYYATLHLEIARYIAFACRASFDLPWTLSRLIGPPPISILRRGCKSGISSPATSPTKSRGVTGGAPSIPTPKKVDPIAF